MEWNIPNSKNNETSTFLKKLSFHIHVDKRDCDLGHIIKYQNTLFYRWVMLLANFHSEFILTSSVRT